jgi:hypothetical protein
MGLIRLNNQSLTAVTSAGLPSGTVLQVQTATKTNAQNTASTTFVDVDDLSISLTPKSTSSKIILMCDVTSSGNGGLNSGDFKFVRDSTDIGVGASSGSKLVSSFTSFMNSSSQDTDSSAGFAVDTPNTTSAVTYKLQMRCIKQDNSGSSQELFINRSRGESDNDTFSRTASNIIAMEIAG